VTQVNETAPTESHLLQNLTLPTWKRCDWLLCILIGAIGIHIMEVMYRLHYFTEFFSVRTIITLEPFRFIAGIGLFYGFRRAPSFLKGWAWLIFFITISRVLVSYYAHEPLMNVYVWWGLAMLIYGLYATTQNESRVRELIGGAFILCMGLLIGGNDFLDVFAVDFRLGWWMGALFVAAITIAVQEYVARKGSFEKFFPKYYFAMLPFSCAVNFGLYYGYTYAVPTFMFAWAVYTIFDVTIRIGNNALMGEPFKLVHALGMSLIVGGTFLTYIGGLH